MGANAKTQLFTAITGREEGQGLAEYAFILAFVALVAVVFLETMGLSVADFFHRAGEVFAGILGVMWGAAYGLVL